MESSTDYSPQQIDSLERDALNASNRIISSIENAMAVWEAAKDKPDGLEMTMTRLRNVRERLCVWEAGLLKSAGRSGLPERVRQLQKFSEIFRYYK